MEQTFIHVAHTRKEDKRNQACLALKNVWLYLEKHLSFANTHGADFISHQHWETFVPAKSQQQLLALTKEELVNLPQHRICSPTNCNRQSDSGENHNDTSRCTIGHENDADHWLSSFITDAYKCHLENTATVSTMLDVVNSLDELKNIAENSEVTSEAMSEKKSHEIKAISEAVVCLYKCCKADVVVDVGSGKGYLGCELARHHKLPVLGLDSSDTNTQGALQRDGRLAKRWKGLTRRKERQKRIPQDGSTLACSKTSEQVTSLVPDCSKTFEQVNTLVPDYSKTSEQVTSLVPDCPKTFEQVNTLVPDCSRTSGQVTYLDNNSAHRQYVNDTTHATKCNCITASNHAKNNNNVTDSSHVTGSKCATNCHDVTGSIRATNCNDVTGSKCTTNCNVTGSNCVTNCNVTDSNHTRNSNHASGSSNHATNCNDVTSSNRVTGSNFVANSHSTNNSNHVTCNNFVTDTSYVTDNNDVTDKLKSGTTCGSSCLLLRCPSEVNTNLSEVKDIEKCECNQEMQQTQQHATTVSSHGEQSVHVKFTEVLKLDRRQNSCEDTGTPGISLYVPVTLSVHPDMNLQKILADHACRLDLQSHGQTKVLLTGLHTCGSLSVTVMKLFLQNPQVVGLCYVGCCYQLMDESIVDDMSLASHMTHFPLSQFGKQKGIHLGRNARNLASQSVARIQASGQLQGADFYWRAMLDVLLHDLGLSVPERILGMRGLNKKSKSFQEYVQAALHKLHISPDLVNSDIVAAVEDKCQGMKEKMSAYFQLKLILAPVIEALVLLDRYLYLLEQDSVYDAHIIRMFDPVTSPRCYAIIAVKDKEGGASS